MSRQAEVATFTIIMMVTSPTEKCLMVNEFPVVVPVFTMIDGENQYILIGIINKDAATTANNNNNMDNHKPWKVKITINHGEVGVLQVVERSPSSQKGW